jgi:hypothetical protein
MRFPARFSELLPLLLAPAAALAIVSFASFGCRDMRPRSQEWVVFAPEKAIVGVSLHLGWTLERPEVREAIARYPVFDQALEIFLDKVKIDPASETARASLYLLEIPRANEKITSLDDLGGMALIQLAGFRDPRAVQRVVVENFPPEGSLRMGGREYPLFVFFDINNLHLRVFLDSDDRLWIGDMAALQGVAKRRFAGESSPLARAAEWIQASGAVQGFVQPELLPREAIGDMAADAIPAGVRGLAWSVSTTEKDPEAASLSLAATGTEEGVAAVKPWVQRLAAVVSAASSGGPPPETLQERARMGLKCQLKQGQMNKVFEMMNLGPAIMLPLEIASPKPGAKK